ncbi:hypothetical protein JCGZ_05339 [Jatropha curcas]|uniref:MYB family protein n=1 Tax=Jatropha curcas TaxID=180498 RepID=A0A067L078_JATCU|nr:uncharacterized protein LOC105634317 [Jatropha curcas]AIT52214.1 MYB family protein [Jatropha curcas]KDP37900.1 hypothetical protein JCGZ_05339 [Jatropha curcas]
MSVLMQNDDDEEEISSGNEDDGFHEDMEALRRACSLAGTNINDLDVDTGGNNSHSTSAVSADGNYSGCEDDDFELFRNVQNRFSVQSDSLEPISLMPVCAIPPDLDNDEDDFETLCAVRSRFSAYDNSNILRRGEENLLEKRGSIEASSILVSEIDTSNDSLIGRRDCEVLVNTEEGVNTANLLSEIHLSGSAEQDTCKPSWVLKDSSSFPKSAQVFVDAIKRNRCYQKFLRSKLAQIEARIEENKKLKERVKILRDFQASCRKITGRALAQGKDPRIQLITARRDKINEQKFSAMHNGPAENSHAANYRAALATFPLTLNRKKWTEVEKENLRKGIRQQFQEMVLQFSVDQFSCSEGSSSNANNLDAILASIGEMEITPESIREFLPKVDWDRLASLYVVGRTGAECEAQWLNCEDPLINNNEWTVIEDKKLLFIVQEKGMTNWFDIAVSLGTNRTPFQCLERFQRSLNARILKREWTKEEDAQLRVAVEIYGENDWQSVASTLAGRTGPQCSNRWRKSLRPNKMGRWTLNESKRLEVAVMLFGPKNWKNIARFVPGRADVQCRERWSNCIDPSLNMDKWTEEEDIRLKTAIEEHGYCWAKVARHLPSRTDSQCRRRWKALFPDEVPLLQAARRTQKAATISNFVDREAERPALGPHDFLPLPIIESISKPENIDQSKKRKRKTREGTVSRKDKTTPPRHISKRRRSKRSEEGITTSSVEQPGGTKNTEVEKSGGTGTVVTKRRMKCCSEKNITEPAKDGLPSNFVSTPLVVTGGTGTDARKKKKLPESHRKRNKLIDTNNQSHLTSQPENSKLGTTNFDGFQTFEGTRAASCKEKRADEHSGTNICTTTNFSEECDMLSGAVMDVPVLAANHLDSNLLVTSNDEQDDAAGKPDARSKKFTKQPQERKIFIESADSVNRLILPPGSSELRVNSSKNVEKSYLDGIYSSKTSTVPSREGQSVVLVPRQQNGHKKSKPKSKSCSKQVFGKNDEDDITLASFLKNKLKKRKLQVVKNADQTVLVTERIDQRDGAKKMSPLMRDIEVQTVNNNGLPENILSRENTDAKQCSNGRISETLPSCQNKETGEVDMVGAVEYVGTNIGVQKDNGEHANSFPPGFEKPIYKIH